ncbi:dnaJ homolog subfamily C member 28 [Notechis scutatus]|uniref:DnaJ homolog subfamily C member 28 n=1 Tax=Notechis scutatus TaxID=8663 RepID=A0A6J1TWH4_9SAUR|nr:dnaJ homolog subfamily C member 28 [Notechis scutatus]XP_026519969.1 dnaJ homolog subfamily C member 28 [Notechis scutatus]XP_026519970.1 dnaJ homolog subfamily C member 28 [Notechis scutatus]XP_026519971.1 dnaJ homolog subfamily C member 28 [Notechis scutatus]
MKWVCAVLMRKMHHHVWMCSALVPKKAKSVQRCFICNCRLMSNHKPQNVLDSYKLLKLQEGCSLDDVKNSFLELAKQFHPDSGSVTADSAIFVQIKEAYRVVVNDMAKKIKSRDKEEDDDEDKLKSKAVQHRQYLNFEGIGFGTPSQRQRQYIQFRVDRASEQIMEYRQRQMDRELAMGDVMLAKDLKQSKKTKITQAIERLVEDLIQESMAKGDFDNLSGKGKPLQKFSDCPHIDPMTHNLNRILIDNGYQPEWILIQKEIRETIEKLRKTIIASRNKVGDPMTIQKEMQWKEVCEEFRENIKILNKRINDFNLVVPILSRQMVHFNADKEIAHVQDVFEAQMKNKSEAEAKKTEAEMEHGRHDTKTIVLKWIARILK